VHADRARNYLALIEHRKLNGHPIEIITLYLASLQRHSMLHPGHVPRGSPVHCERTVKKRADARVINTGPEGVLEEQPAAYREPVSAARRDRQRGTANQPGVRMNGQPLPVSPRQRQRGIIQAPHWHSDELENNRRKTRRAPPATPGTLWQAPHLCAQRKSRQLDESCGRAPAPLEIPASLRVPIDGRYRRLQ
jgi:hypothetical protein